MADMSAVSHSELYELRREISELEARAFKREWRDFQFLMGAIVFWVTVGVLAFEYLAFR